MGLSIHYNGYIFNKQLLDSLIEEVTDICKILKWQSHTFDNDEIKGVSFAPEGSEPVFLTFDHEGRLLSPWNIMVKGIYDDVQIPKEYLFTASAKTQFAGMEAHIAIIKLLKHLSKKYLKDFTLIDEGYYWETDDEKILTSQFEKFESAINIFRDAIKDLPAVPDDTAESLSSRLEKLLKDKFGKKEE